ncbi:hypothetical protein ACFVH6_22240 [Spirillospora sp. NPDC127200]
MSHHEARCELTDLLVDQCAHCRNIPDPAAAPKAAPLSAAARAKSLATHVDDLMLIMNTNKLKAQPKRVGGAFPLRHYDRAEPFSLTGVTHRDVLDQEFFTNATPWDLHEPLDVVVANRVSDGQLFGEDFAVRRVRVVKRPYLPLERIARCMVESSYLGIDSASGTAHSSVKYYGMNSPSGEWIELPPRGFDLIGAPGADEETAGLLSLATGIQFTRDYTWRVHLKYPGADIGVMIPTTPQGIRALFRLRDYEAGESRRKALTHWVSGHSRRLHADTPQEDLVWVRDHLRGAFHFKWQDMHGAIYPAAHDLRRLKAMKRERRKR